MSGQNYIPNKPNAWSAHSRKLYKEFWDHSAVPIDRTGDNFLRENICAMIRSNQALLLERFLISGNAAHKADICWEPLPNITNKRNLTLLPRPFAAQCNWDDINWEDHEGDHFEGPPLFYAVAFVYSRFNVNILSNKCTQISDMENDIRNSIDMLNMLVRVVGMRQIGWNAKVITAGGKRKTIKFANFDDFLANGRILFDLVCPGLDYSIPVSVRTKKEKIGQVEEIKRTNLLPFRPARAYQFTYLLAALGCDTPIIEAIERHYPI